MTPKQMKEPEKLSDFFEKLDGADWSINPPRDRQDMRDRSEINFFLIWFAMIVALWGLILIAL